MDLDIPFFQEREYLLVLAEMRPIFSPRRDNQMRFLAHFLQVKDVVGAFWLRRDRKFCRPSWGYLKKGNATYA